MLPQIMVNSPWVTLFKKFLHDQQSSCCSWLVFLIGIGITTG